jgi:hypothetical protein
MPMLPLVLYEVSLADINLCLLLLLLYRFGLWQVGQDAILPHPKQAWSYARADSA